MKRNILKLNFEQLKKVVEKNSKLENYIEESLIDYHMNCNVDELLRELRTYLKDWSIGFNNYNYIEIKDISAWGNWLTDITEILDGYLTNDELSYINKVEKAQDRFYNMDYDNKQYQNLEDWLYEQNKKINDILLRLFNDLTSCDLLNIDCLVEYALEMELLSNFYVDTKTNLIYEKQPQYALFGGF